MGQGGGQGNQSTTYTGGANVAANQWRDPTERMNFDPQASLYNAPQNATYGGQGTYQGGGYGQYQQPYNSMSAPTYGLGSQYGNQGQYGSMLHAGGSGGLLGGYSGNGGGGYGGTRQLGGYAAPYRSQMPQYGGMSQYGGGYGGRSQPYSGYGGGYGGMSPPGYGGYQSQNPGHRSQNQGYMSRQAAQQPNQSAGPGQAQADAYNTRLAEIQRLNGMPVTAQQPTQAGGGPSQAQADAYNIRLAEIQKLNGMPIEPDQPGIARRFRPRTGPETDFTRTMDKIWASDPINYRGMMYM